MTTGLRRWSGDHLTAEQLEAAVGTEVGVSPWRVVTQEMIDQFADATDDHQFIHVDPERAAKAESPFGGTIAHGFLSLSLLSAMTYETLPVRSKASASASTRASTRSASWRRSRPARASAPASCWREVKARPVRLDPDRPTT